MLFTARGLFSQALKWRKNDRNVALRLRHTVIYLYVFTFSSRLTTIFLVGGLGVEDQQNDFGEVLILLHVIFLGARLKRKSADQNQKKGNNKSETLLSPFLLTFSEKCFSLCLPGCRSDCKTLGPMLKSDAK
jgi:hypothetical protein